MKLAVAGSPVAHSLSPLIHNAALQACGIDGTYVAIECDTEGFVGVIAALRSGELDGCNVTMPHKQLAHDLVDTAVPVAARAGAVNTIVREADRLVGHNTDVAGIVQASTWAGLPVEAPVLVLGAGGAAAAALLAYEQRSLFVAARRREAAESLVERLGVDAVVLDFGTPLAGAIVANATPLGMHGENLPEGVLAAAAGLFEMPYASGTTPATTMMRELDRPVAVGEDMLLAQAIEAFALWTGCVPPVAPIRAALHNKRPF